jgi:hypothetical protein
MALSNDDGLPEIVLEMLDQSFSPHGITDDPEIPRCLSIPNYIAQRIVLDGYIKLPAPEPAL